MLARGSGVPAGRTLARRGERRRERRDDTEAPWRSRLRKLFGGDKAKPRGAERSRHADDAGQDGPDDAGRATTRSRRSRSWSSCARRPPASATPRKLPLIGHLPVVKQFQVLGMLLVDVPRVRGADGVPRRRGSRRRARRPPATATEMQMLSQRLARGTALASQGQAARVRGGEGQPRALQGRPRRAAAAAARSRASALDVGAGRRRRVKLLNDIKARWERVDAAAERLLDNEQSLTSLAKGLDALNAGQQRAARARAAGVAQQIGAGRRQPARARVREPARGAVAADRQERQRARVVATRSIPKSRSCSARTPARSATS